MSQIAQHNATPGRANLSSLPLYLDLAGKHCLIIGGGEAAVTMVRQLFNVGANMTVVSADVHPKLVDWAIGEAITLIRRLPEKPDFNGVALAFVAVDDRDQQVQYAAMARDADVLVNIVNAPVSFARRYREAVRKTTQKQTNQNRFWQGLLDRPIDEAVLTGQKAWPAANDVQQGGGIA